MLNVYFSGTVVRTQRTPVNGPFDDHGVPQYQLVNFAADGRLYVGPQSWAKLQTPDLSVELAQGTDFMELRELEVVHIINGREVDSVFSEIRRVRDGDQVLVAATLEYAEGKVGTKANGTAVRRRRFSLRPVQVQVIKKALVGAELSVRYLPSLPTDAPIAAKK
jgi:hypothetical protein